MKRSTSIVLAGLLVAALLLSACQQQGQPIPADPVEAVRTIIDKQKDVKTEHTDITLDLVLKIEGLAEGDPSAAILKNFKANVTVGGDVDSTAQDFSLKGTADLGVLTAFLSDGADKLEFEAVKVGETMYTRLAGKDWAETPMKAATGAGAPAADVAQATEQLNQLLKKTAKAERLGDEAIDGADSYHFKVTLDAVELISEISKLAKDSGSTVDQAQLDQANQLLKDTVITVEMWVGKADLLVRQQKVHLGLNLKNIPDAPPEATVNADFNLTLKASKINQPVTISKPK